MGHTVFLAGYEVARPCLKPGQDQLLRQNYYTSEQKPIEETYVAEDMSTQFSEYHKNISTRTMPVDYEDPQKPMRPPVVENTAGHTGTAHWRSEYASMLNAEALTGSVPHRQTGPSYASVHVPSVVSAPNELSMYSKDFGEYGSNPRARLSSTDSKLPNPKHELTVGTTKGTCHIPGYQGFLPMNTNNPRVAAIEAGEHIRTCDKTNLYEIYHLNVPGYAGHVPGNAQNDRGSRQINSFSTSGKELSAVSGFVNGNI